jgi:hypothetical protein
MGWGYAPDSGGTKISERTKLDVQYRLEQYAEKHYAGRYTRLTLRTSLRDPRVRLRVPVVRRELGGQ